jgi:hypothetical protein
MEKEQLLSAFETVFGWEATAVYSAAGRVNLIGEHIDYEPRTGHRVKVPDELLLTCGDHLSIRSSCPRARHIRR